MGRAGPGARPGGGSGGGSAGAFWKERREAPSGRFCGQRAGVRAGPGRVWSLGAPDERVVIGETQEINMEVVVLKIEDPSCFWIAVKDYVPGIVSETVYENLNAEMKQFYNSYRDSDAIKQEEIEKGQVYVVFSEELKCWCRALVESVWCQADGYQLGCFLVDYAKYCSVASENVRVLVGAFAKIPHRAKKCRLHCTKPLTLHIDYCENTAKIGPAKKWDTAAIQHFRKLLDEATEVKATIQAVEDEVLEVFLFVTVRDEKICINDDLVAKHFAHYKEGEGTAESSTDDSDNEVSLNAECVPVEFVGPTFLARPKLPFGDTMSPHLEPGLASCNSVLEKTSQRSHTVLNDNTVPVVSMVPDVPSKEDKAVQTERLPQFLNSNSLQTQTVEDDQQSFQNAGKEKNFVFLSKKIEPSSVLETAPLFDGLKKELPWNKLSACTFTESYCWPPLAWGFDVVAISQQGHDPLLYIPPVLTLLQLESDYQALPNMSGPLALILCPGWKKAQLVFDLLKTYRKGCSRLHPMLIILGQNKDAARQVEIRGCEVVVTTPFNLLRLLEHNTGLLCRLCHLVLDEIEVLFSDTTEQVFTILDCYKKATAQAQRNLPHQIIAVGTQWNKHITPLIKEFMHDPHIVITVIEEAAIFGNVQQVVQPCMNSNRTAELLKILNFTQRNLQKVLVFSDSVDEVEMIHKVLKSNSVVSLKKHRDSKCNAECVLERWRKMHSSGTQAVLVLTDDCLQSLGITDATCVIHFSFPSPGVFGQRLQSMSDNFCSGIKDSTVDQEHMKAKSVILLTENSSCHALGILRYLKHAEAEIPEELYDLTARVLESEENEKFSRPLCASLKTFGICRNRTECPDRHQINLSIDMAQNIADEMIETPERVTILPLFIVHATNYFGRIVKKQKDQYTVLAKEINDYFKLPGHRISASTVEKSVFYGLCEGAICHRVQVVETPAKDEENVCKVTIKYIDEGRTSQVNSDQLLHLPAKFQSLPPQAVEIVVCRVKPIDNEVEWNPKVTDHINHKIKGKLHHAKVMHTLGKTVWVDPMVGVTNLPTMKMWVNEYNIRSEILSTGLGTDNPEHIGEIQKLCRQIPVLDHAESLEHLRTRPETAVEKFGTSVQALLERSTKEDTAGLEEASSPQETLIQENATESANGSVTPPSNNVLTKEAEDSTVHQQKGYHPQIKWFQDNVTVTLKVQILRAADSKCEFYREKVTFSAYSEGKLYVADLELYESVIAETCTCLIKDTEAVILLVKEKKGMWCKLLKNKNVHVSLDFEHWEESEDGRPFTVVGCSHSHIEESSH
ncbi:putative ATP-dependent RNA helicase TDRD12 isoform X3 [Cyanistes caeruleus]|uniref:putative ATP-dependent RNA helicase TDRD12 isoform X3 n=1 Tax=Cyanistes caeruleus TaxID=156563 RepID=UPI000CDB87B4|nr:putative ATP-dependent RNA helicase TDRD12 isoform X3 [Cyanistes caeruleus]